MHVRMVLGDVRDPADPYPVGADVLAGEELPAWRARQRARRLELLERYRAAADELLDERAVVAGELELEQRSDQGIVLRVRPHVGRRAAAGFNAFRLSAWALTVAGELAARTGHAAHPHNLTVTNR